jgi:hypothetical protein
MLGEADQKPYQSYPTRIQRSSTKEKVGARTKASGPPGPPREEKVPAETMKANGAPGAAPREGFKLVETWGPAPLTIAERRRPGAQQVNEPSRKLPDPTLDTGTQWHHVRAVKAGQSDMSVKNMGIDDRENGVWTNWSRDHERQQY